MAELSLQGVVRSQGQPWIPRSHPKWLWQGPDWERVMYAAAFALGFCLPNRDSDTSHLPVHSSEGPGRSQDLGRHLVPPRACQGLSA